METLMDLLSYQQLWTRNKYGRGLNMDASRNRECPHSHTLLSNPLSYKIYLNQMTNLKIGLKSIVLEKQSQHARERFDELYKHT